jgi:hypothetical protein
MKIQVVDGSVAFPDGNIIRHMDRQTFLQSQIAKSSKVAVANEPWVTYNFTPEPGVSCNAIFKNDCLQQLFLLMSMPTDDPSQWTADREHERKRKHDEWLRMELGSPPYNYSWGSVVSEFDPRGCVSDIIVTYAE